jgi:soluble lytic murein transglycosylase
MRTRFSGAVGLIAITSIASHAFAWDNGPLCAVESREEDSGATTRQEICLTPNIRSRPTIPWTEPVTAEHARESWQRAEAAMAMNKPDAALLDLRVVRYALPALSDRIALEEAEALTAMGQHKAACAAYAIAAEGLDRDVAIEGRIGGVRCLLAAGSRAGEDAFNALLRRYPLLPESDALRVELARAREGWGNRFGAAALYRQIDLTHPGGPEADQSRLALAQLAAGGFAVRDLTLAERVQRAEALVQGGPVDEAHAAVTEFDHVANLPPDLRAHVLVLLAKLARVEGRWDEARAAIAKANRQGVEVVDAAKLVPPPAAADNDATTLREATAQVAAIVRGRTWPRLTNLQLRAVGEIAGRYGLPEPANAVLAEMAVRKNIWPDARFEAAMRLSGLASDEHVADVLAAARGASNIEAAVHYHYARALERLGRASEAELEYHAAIEHDHSETHYYRLWSEQRQWEMRNETTLSCLPTPPEADSLPPNPFDAAPVDGTHLLTALDPIVEAHGAAYPWLARARGLIVLERYTDAANELNETYLAWRDATGGQRLRSGLEAVLTGSAPPRRPADWNTRKARLLLDTQTRMQLAVIAQELGDPGIAYRFGGGESMPRPRAYAELVERAAHRQGLDPNLLFAVMRVESIYNRRIVSTAGAVGLMQIMPRTAHLIAEQLGMRDFDTSDLLDPETNVELAAWYLASLLTRFDQRLPLAIAAYNGGPHNVRLWLRQSHPNMPLDVFLERIPFEQTHRYVRRVLSHMAAYRAQADLPMTRLATDLPPNRPDSMAF